MDKKLIKIIFFSFLTSIGLSIASIIISNKNMNAVKGSQGKYNSMCNQKKQIVIPQDSSVLLFQEI